MYRLLAVVVLAVWTPTPVHGQQTLSEITCGQLLTGRKDMKLMENMFSGVYLGALGFGLYQVEAAEAALEKPGAKNNEKIRAIAHALANR